MFSVCCLLFFPHFFTFNFFLYVHNFVCLCSFRLFCAGFRLYWMQSIKFMVVIISHLSYPLILNSMKSFTFLLIDSKQLFRVFCWMLISRVICHFISFNQFIQLLNAEADHFSFFFFFDTIHHGWMQFCFWSPTIIWLINMYQKKQMNSLNEHNMHFDVFNSSFF